MFTGLIETTATLSAIQTHTDGKDIVVSFPRGTGQHDARAIGDSIAINGTCLTVTQIKGDDVSFHAISETLNKTTLGSLVVGHRVNIESACQATSRLGGHLVQGHIDCVGEIVDMSNAASALHATAESSQVVIAIKLPREQMPYMVDKGSVCLDGVSLTISRVKRSPEPIIEVSVIPLTWEKTTLSDRLVGDRLNVEVDVIAKYVHNACQPYLADISRR